MSDDEHLATGRDPDTPATDSIERASVLATAERMGLVAGAMGQPLVRTPDVVVTDTGLPEAMANWALLLRPLTGADDPVLDEIAGAYPAGRPYLLMSAWPTPDLARRGLIAAGHPPFMLRPAGRPEAVPDIAGFEVSEAVDRAGIEVVERVLIEGYPLPSLQPVRTGAFLDDRALGGAFRCFVGRLDGRPVTTASVTVAHGVGLVEFVATMADARGKGFGAMVTLAAALADPSLPSVLIASDDGRPVYERLGYLSLNRWTLWMRG